MQVQIEKVVTLIEEGRSYRYVARKMNVSPSVVSWVLNRYLETGSYVRRAGQGRNRITTIQQDRFLRNCAIRRRTSTARDLKVTSE